MRTYQPGDDTGGRSHRISPPSFCGACLNFYREKDSAVSLSLIDREVDFVYPQVNCFPLVFSVFCFFCKEKSHFV